MDFMTSIKTCFSKYADFKGRARRSEFWWFALAAFVLETVARVISPLLYGLVVLALLVPYFAAAARRLHDTGKSGWFILVPIYNLVLLVSDSTPGDNQYGPNPKGVGGQGWGAPPAGSEGQQYGTPPPPPPVG